MRKHTAEEIIVKPHPLDILPAQSTPFADMIRQMGVTKVPHHRRLEENGALKSDQVRRKTDR